MYLRTGAKFFISLVVGCRYVQILWKAEGVKFLKGIDAE
jgi:hypothetical protein